MPLSLPIAFHIPTWNRAENLHRFLDSLASLSPSFPPVLSLSVNIYDNHSHDTTQLVAQYFQSYPFPWLLTYTRHSSNIGGSGNILYCIRSFLHSHINLILPDDIIFNSQCLGLLHEISLTSVESASHVFFLDLSTNSKSTSEHSDHLRPFPVTQLCTSSWLPNTGFFIKTKIPFTPLASTAYPHIEYILFLLTDPDSTFSFHIPSSPVITQQITSRRFSLTRASVDFASILDNYNACSFLYATYVFHMSIGGFFSFLRIFILESTYFSPPLLGPSFSKSFSSLVYILSLRILSRLINLFSRKNPRSRLFPLQSKDTPVF